MVQLPEMCGEPHNKQPLLQNAYGTWWGRTCSGQAIYMDNIIQEIALLTL